MSLAPVNGVNLYYELHGEGFPLVWCHEFAGDFRSWRHQVRFFQEHYRVVVYNARGYPPSDVPKEPAQYSQEQAAEDLRGLLDHLGVEQAHVGGFSMGGSVALHFALHFPHRSRSLILAGVGTGSANAELYRQRVEEFARRLEAEGMAAMVDYPRGPHRIQLLRKNPDGWRKFAEQFLQQSNRGLAMTLRGVQGGRPSTFALEAGLRALDVPTLILVGDEDDPCLEPSLFLKRCLPRSGLVIFPQTGHTLNLEEPERFNQEVLKFLQAVEEGRWAKRDTGVASAALVT